MTEEEKDLLAKIVEGLLNLDSQTLSRRYSLSLLGSAERAGLLPRMPGWVPREDSEDSVG